VFLANSEGKRAGEKKYNNPGRQATLGIVAEKEEGPR